LLGSPTGFTTLQTTAGSTTRTITPSALSHLALAWM